MTGTRGLLILPVPPAFGAQNQLCHLLRDGGSAFHHPQMHRVVHGGASDGDRIDARMPFEPAVLRGDRCRCNVSRNRSDPFAARSAGRERCVKNDAVPIDNPGSGIASDDRDRPEPDPGAGTDRRDDDRG